MRHYHLAGFSLISAALAATSYGQAVDENAWLEDRNGAKALEWVEQANAKARQEIEAKPLFKALLADSEALSATGGDKPTEGQTFVAGPYAYKLERDQTHPRGILRRAAWDGFAQQKPQWRTLLDLDALSAREQKSWQLGFQYALGDSGDANSAVACRPPAYDRCIIFLSDGGQDAAVAREFDVAKSSFVPDGFVFGPMRATAVWSDADHLLVGSDKLSDFKIPMELLHWRRGTPASKAQVLLKSGPNELGVSAGFFGSGPTRQLILYKHTDFFKKETYVWRQGTTPVRLNLGPTDQILGAAGNKLIFVAGSSADGKKEGAVYAASVRSLASASALALETVFVPKANQALQMGSQPVVSQNRIYLTITEDVAGQLLRIERNPNGRWVSTRIGLPALGAVRVNSSNLAGSSLLLAHEAPVVAPVQYRIDRAGAPKIVSREKGLLDPNAFVTERYFATSRDGTRVPYFVTRPKAFTADGSTPAILTGYGGFSVNFSPAFALRSRYALLLSTLLKNGGVLVTGNMRGGGEYGPAWYNAGVRANKQNTWDDFYTIAEDLIRRKITSPSKLGIIGASHGGLLMGVAYVQRPDLFRVIWSDVPGMDMLRFHSLGSSGAIVDYGNPDNAEDRAHILKWSPYHNINSTLKYPPMLLTTNRADDRVSPAHARKMYARLSKLGQPVLFYEASEGGHTGPGGPKERAWWNAFTATFVLEPLLSATPR